jgi:hypothetical protein
MPKCVRDSGDQNGSLRINGKTNELFFTESMAAHSFGNDGAPSVV